MIRCCYICFGLQFGWCVNVIRTVWMSCIHYGPCVDVYQSERNELLRINTYAYPYNPNWDTHCTNLKPNGMIRAVRQNVLTCQKMSRTLPYRPISVRIATHQSHGTNQFQRVSPNRFGKAIRRNSASVRQGYKGRRLDWKKGGSTHGIVGKKISEKHVRNIKKYS